MKIKFTRVSSNRKLGPIPASMTERASCAPGCPLLQAECYGEGGPTRIWWDRIPELGISVKEFCGEIRALPLGQLWRHDVVGDLPHVGGYITKAFTSIVEANRGRRGFTYTHHDLSLGRNFDAVKWANDNGFAVNASRESVEDAAKAVDRGLPAVAIVPSNETRKSWKLDSGHTVVRCPATYDGSKVTCATCGACANPKRKTIIAFPAHGSRMRKLDKKLKGEK